MNYTAQPNGKCKCDICGKEYSPKGIGTHIWRKHGNGKKFNPNSSYKNGRTAWNKGLTKETDDRVKQYAETYSKNLKDGKIKGWNGRKHKDITKKKISEKLSINNKGGRCKWYKVERVDGVEFNVQGTWERDFSKVLNIIDEKWIKIGIGDRNHSFKWIDDKGKEHTYSPDFYSPKLKKYFEVKGYWWGDDKRKMELVLEQNNINIEIIKKKELKNYLKLI